jgi:UDP-N-acetylglucosamine--dolichyl-phosphate N-acetylglucosaminephosphotransferase
MMKIPFINVGLEILIILLLSFFAVLVVMPLWIRKMKQIGIVGKDMNKYNKPKIAEMGGVPVVMAFVFSLLFYVGLSTFYYGDQTSVIPVLACISTLLIIAVIGMIDDIFGWKIGLKQKHKVLLTIPAALPIMFINAGHSTMFFPFFGELDLGILYPLVIIPLGIIGAANGFNMLAGYNGLEAGMGVIILSTLGGIAYLSGNGLASLIAFVMVFALLAFLKYNWYPAKIFPGDTLTYSVGAVIAIVAILGNMEKIAILLYALYFLDFLLPMRKRFHIEAFAKPRRDNSLEMPYDKGYRGIHDLTHFALFLLKKFKKKVYEKDVTLFVLGLQIIITLTVLGLWYLQVL